ncbi:MAG: PEGA domain-containing protein [Sedimentisphaerales bacterium]
MRRHNLFGLLVFILAVNLLFVGCVERKLTINTEPQGALVVLNDEEIGISPVTVSFEWYGDYNVRISKEGYETLKTHRRLKGPWYDQFPFDFFAMLNPRRTVDSYKWTFELAPKAEATPEELIDAAQRLKSER